MEPSSHIISIYQHLRSLTFAADPPVTDIRPFRIGEYVELDPLSVFMKSVIGVAHYSHSLTADDEGWLDMIL